MSNEFTEIIKNTLMELTNLEENQILIASIGGDRYKQVYVVKNNQIVNLGEIHQDFLNGESDINKQVKFALIRKFSELTAKKYYHLSYEVPILYGNPKSFNQVYLDIYQNN